MKVDSPAAIDVETTGERRSDTADPRRATFQCAAIAPHGIVTFTPPVIHPGAQLTIHNHPYDAVVLGVSDAVWDDTKMIAFLGGEFDTSLKGLTVKYLNKPVLHYEEAVERGEVDRYCLDDADNTWALRPILYDALTPGCQELYDTLERPLLPLWAEMTIRGSYYLDRPGLVSYADELRVQVAELERVTQDALPRGALLSRCTACGRDKALVGTGDKCADGGHHHWKGGDVYDSEAPVNINSPDQLLEGLRAAGLSLSSTDKTTLAMLDRRHPAISTLLEYRRLNKRLTTYVLPWLETDADSRMGCVWRPVGTGTGRVSSARPNLQNVVAELEKYWLPAPGRRFLTFDNGQLEVRCAAVLSGDPALTAACFARDFHGEMMTVFGLDDRRLTKVWVFGCLYLGGPGALLAAARTYGLTNMRKQEAIDGHAEVHRRLPDYFRWADKQAEKRYVQGMFGAVHIIPPGKDDDATGRRAVNYPIQGAAGRITKYQMLALWRAGYDIISQVHDSITVEVDEGDVERARLEIPAIMTTACDFPVPLVVEEKGT